MQAKINQSENDGARLQNFEEFIDKNEVGRRLRMRPRTIDDWMKRGLLPYYKVGRSVRFKWSDVEAYLASRFRVCQ